MKVKGFSIRVDGKLQKEFSDKCNDNLQTQSKVIRELMKLYIKKGNKIFKEVK